jgi:hypothetical protein
VLDIPRVSFEDFGISQRYPKTRKDIPKSENLEWDIPKLRNGKCRVSFFVLGYLSLSHPILVPILFSAMQLVARKSCLAQPNDCYISLPTVHTPFAKHNAAHVYLLVHSSSLTLPTPRLFRRSLEAAEAGPAGARFAAPPPPRPTCTAGRGVGALPSALPRRPGLQYWRLRRHRRGGCRAEAVPKAAVAESVSLSHDQDIWSRTMLDVL